MIIAIEEDGEVVGEESAAAAAAPAPVREYDTEEETWKKEKPNLC